MSGNTRASQQGSNQNKGIGNKSAYGGASSWGGY